ncbi:hypothetical protein M422DRAFT_38544 [Sphaerobolus stellatus SS14]|uniref:Uncharacterized protein n=1 Tax=Sphaerobolus stellatus (strain SS14) TaxID=990650 RepID=A0A0C9T9B8_SPHS4|nr:hypothetical protein M422DRAFT_38544 [Sphaerobolus stellatus SS14]
MISAIPEVRILVASPGRIPETGLHPTFPTDNGIKSTQQALRSNSLRFTIHNNQYGNP